MDKVYYVPGSMFKRPRLFADEKEAREYAASPAIETYYTSSYVRELEEKVRELAEVCQKMHREVNISEMRRKSEMQKYENELARMLRREEGLRDAIKRWKARAEGTAASSNADSVEEHYFLSNRSRYNTHKLVIKTNCPADMSYEQVLNIVPAKTEKGYTLKQIYRKGNLEWLAVFEREEQGEFLFES